MDRKEKKEKRSFIGSLMDLANSRFKDTEIDTLFDVAKNREKYHGKSKTYKSSYTDWSSDGKYTRDEETTYTFLGDDEGVRIKKKYKFKDDDGMSGENESIITGARDILNTLHKILGK